MRIAQTISACMVMLAVFLAPFQGACCMAMSPKAQMQPQDSPHGCCTSAMVTQTVPLSQPLLPCHTREGECTHCTHTVMSNQSCGMDVVSLSIESHLPVANWLALELRQLAAIAPQPVALPCSIAMTDLPSVTARSLCSQHCLLTV